MKIITDILTDKIAESVVQTIGFFDGVHKGHQYLLSQVKATASDLGLKSMVITFRNHPSKVLHPEKMVPLLTTTEEKLQLLETYGIDYVVLLDFNEQLSQMSAKDFMTDILKDRLNGKALIIGYDHHFGHPVPGDGFDEYQRQGKEIGLQVVLAKELPTEDASHTSSTAIRKALQEGDIRQATQMLDHPYCIEGKVTHGEGIGHTLGFPTANICVNPDKILPKEAAYAVKVTLGNNAHTPDNDTTLAGMLYIGTRPTFENLMEKRVEVFILDFNGEIYGKDIRVEVVDFLRGERHFDSPESLKAQLQQDCQHVKQLINRTQTA